MTTPYDLKALADGMKLDGLDVTEVAAGKVAQRMLVWLKESAQLSPNKVDDLVMGVVSSFEGEVMAAIDKINGKVGA